MDELFKKLQGDNQNGSDYLSQFVQHWRDLSDAERKAIDELDELRSKLLSKETEISLLHADINMLSADRDNKIVDVEALAAQVRKLREENDTVLATIQSIESELENLKAKNAQLSEELLKKADYVTNVEMEKLRSSKSVIDDKIKELELQVKKLEKERDDLVEEHEAIEVEREEELRALQNALDDALEQKTKIQTKYEKEFQNLKSNCSAQEQQLMDDFEWKLRQVEQSWKKKIQEKEKQCDEKLQDLRSILEKELSNEKEKLKEERVQVDQQMRQVCHLKSYEVEVVQLRGLTHEQQRALRSAARQIEHLKFSEKVCHDELCTVRSLLDKQKAHLQAVQMTHQHRLEVQEESIQAKLDKQRNELNSAWEDRMRGECSRLKQDLCKLHIEEKHLAVESMKLQKEQGLSSARQVWERQRKDLLHEISKLKDTITEKESASHREMDKIITQADRETWELRRILEKTTNNHSDQMTRLQDKHSEEMDSLQRRHDDLLEKLNEVQAALKDAQEKLQQKTQDEAAYLNDRLGVMIPLTNAVNKSDSGCGDDTSESDRDAENDGANSEECSEEEVDDDDDAMVTASIGTCGDSQSSNLSRYDEAQSTMENEDVVVTHLREEVANLQGSIEKLTSTLITPTSVGEEAAASGNGINGSLASISDEGSCCESSSEAADSDEEEEAEVEDEVD